MSTNLCSSDLHGCLFVGGTLWSETFHSEERVNRHESFAHKMWTVVLEKKGMNPIPYDLLIKMDRHNMLSVLHDDQEMVLCCCFCWKAQIVLCHDFQEPAVRGPFQIVLTFPDLSFYSAFTAVNDVCENAIRAPPACSVGWVQYGGVRILAVDNNRRHQPCVCPAFLGEQIVRVHWAFLWTCLRIPPPRWIIPCIRCALLFAIFVLREVAFLAKFDMHRLKILHKLRQECN